MVKFSCANNRRRYRRLVKQPRERDLCARDASRLGNFSHALYNRFVRFLSPGIKFFAVLISLTASSARLRFPGASKTTARQWAPWQHPNTFRQAKRQHLSFLLAIQQVVMRLHRNETRPTVEIGQVKCLAELPRKHR